MGADAHGRCSGSAYITTGTSLVAERCKRSDAPVETVVGKIPPVEQAITLASGDNIILTCAPTPGGPAEVDDQGKQYVKRSANLSQLQKERDLMELGILERVKTLPKAEREKILSDRFLPADGKRTVAVREGPKRSILGRNCRQIEVTENGRVIVNAWVTDEIGGGATFTVFETNPFTALWSVSVSDGSGYAGATAFDFLGDEGAEAMYADEVYLFIYDDAGFVELQTPRASWTQFEYPVVADVDNDGSAEIVVISNAGYSSSTLPPLQVIRDAEERWVSARRIWNQHTYHVTNVKEDGTIPQFEPPNWESVNTFRIQHRLDEAPDAPILE